jgi:uncharacterized protein (TIGR02453 family)
MSYVRRLRRSNTRAWFEAHRAEYMQARERFEQVVECLIAELAAFESLGALSPKDCIFRMNRDLRFSKDKTPFKPYMSAYIAPGGRRTRRLGYYLHIGSGNRSMIAGGLHDPEPAQLAAWRSAVDRDPRPLRLIINAPSFRAHFGTLRGQRVKTVPRGYPADHPDIDLIRLKQVLVWRELTDAQVEAEPLVRDVVATCRAMRPFLDFLRKLT